MTEKYARSDASPDNGRRQYLKDSSMVCIALYVFNLIQVAQKRMENDHMSSAS